MYFHFRRMKQHHIRTKNGVRLINDNKYAKRKKKIEIIKTIDKITHRGKRKKNVYFNCLMQHNNLLRNKYTKYNTRIAFKRLRSKSTNWIFLYNYRSVQQTI